MEPMSAEEQGIVAIVFLQKTRGIVESVEQAREGWQGMGQSARRVTLQAYATMSRASGPPVELENGDLQIPFGTFDIVVPRRRQPISTST